MEKEFEEIKKSGNYREPKPYMGKDELWSIQSNSRLRLRYIYPL